MAVTMDYINRAPKKHLECRLYRHTFGVDSITEYTYNKNDKVYGVDLICSSCDVEAFDVIDDDGKRIGARKYFYEAANRYLTTKDENKPTPEELRTKLVVLAKHRTRVDRLSEPKQRLLVKRAGKKIVE